MAEELRCVGDRAGYGGDDAERLARIGMWAATRFAGAGKLPLVADDEVREYVASWDDRQLNHIAAIHETMSDQPAPSNAVAYLNVPTAAGQEGLQRPLEQLAAQDADPDSWGVLFFVNQVVKKPIKKGLTQAIGSTLRLIDRFREYHDRMNIRTCHAVYPSPPNMGAVRADPWDVLLYELVQRKEIITNDAIGISGDADPYVISSDYISSLQQAAVEYPQADILATHIGWHRVGDLTSDANRVIGYWEFLRTERQKLIGRFPVAECSMAVRLSSYAAIRGFNRSLFTREGIDLHQRMTIARRDSEENTPHVRFIEGPFVATDSRRLYAAIERGHGPYQSWDLKDIPFKTGMDSVRMADPASQIQLKPTVLRELILDMEHIYFARLDEAQAADLRNRGRAQFQFDL